MVALAIIAAIALVVPAVAMICHAYPAAKAPDQCPACGYSLAGLANDASCPECGQSAVDRQIALTRSPWYEVLATPLAVVSIALASVFLAATIASGDLLWGFITAILVLGPASAFLLLLGALSRRLTPRAAAVLAAAGTFPATAVLIWGACELASPRHDPFAPLAFSVLVLMSLAPMALGLLIGAAIIRTRSFKARDPANHPRIALQG